MQVKIISSTDSKVVEAQYNKFAQENNIMFSQGRMAVLGVGAPTLYGMFIWYTPKADARPVTAKQNMTSQSQAAEPKPTATAQQGKPCPGCGDTIPTYFRYHNCG